MVLSTSTMVFATLFGAASAVPRVLLFWLMSRERGRIAERLLDSGAHVVVSDVVLDHKGPQRARLVVRSVCPGGRHHR
jgi:hypothetical protein